MSSCCRFHQLRANLAVALLPPCLKEALALGAHAKLLHHAITDLVASTLMRDSAGEDQARARLRDLGIEVREGGDQRWASGPTSR